MIDYVSLALYAVIMSFTPGPNNILSMTSAGEMGFRKSLRFRLGVYLGFTLIMLITSSLNILVAELLPSVLPYLKYMGATYIAYLILKINGIPKMKKKNNNSIKYTFYEGLLLQLFNPKTILYGFSIFSTFIIPYTTSIPALILFSILFSTNAFVATNTWAFAGYTLEKQINNHIIIFRLLMSLGLIYSILTILDVL